MILGWAEAHLNCFNSQIIDKFIDTNGNIYIEQDHQEEFDGIWLILHLKKMAEHFYQKQGLNISGGRTEH